MERERSKVAIRLLPSMADLAFIVPIVLLFCRMGGTAALLSDGDPGWHIRTGDWILANHRVPTQDLFSFTKAGQTWYAWEWLSDVIFSWLNSHLGMAAVLLASVVLISTTFVLVFRMARRRANPLVAIAVTVCGAAASSVHWLARPHLFTLLFTVLFYAALERVRERRTRIAGIPYLALLPLATILWTNLHGGFFVGAVLIAAYASGEFVGAAVATERDIRRAALRRAGWYFASLTGCMAASLVNPYGWRLHAHVWAYLRDPYLGHNIVEFMPLGFNNPAGIFLECLLLAGVVAAFWFFIHGSYIQPVLLIVWAHGALIAARNIPIFAIVAVPPVAAAAECWLRRLPELNVAAWLRATARKINEVAARTAETDIIPRWHAASIMAVVLVAALLYAPAPPRSFRPEYDSKDYPAKAVELLRRDRGARIFTTDVWGGYLIYRLYPRTRVFMDGRSDFYGEDFARKYVAVMNVQYDWEKTLRKFDIDTILLPTDVPLAGALKQCRDWRVVYDDHVALIFQRADMGKTISAAATRGGESRDREITKTVAARGRTIAALKSKT